MSTHRGSCLCGAVAFAATGPLRPVIACHCSQCRRTSGHVWAATAVPLERFGLLREDGLAWFRSSARARRGFCRRCGASLFWEPSDEARISIAAGALDGPTGLSLAAHWHREDAGDYYAPEGPPPPPGPAPARLQGSCLCGACRFALPGPAGPVTACHCSQCRKLSGHYAASFDADEAELSWLAREALAIFATPGGSRRGFCARCGASLWFRAADGAFSVEAGAIAG
ncbi:MAG: GFA family protein, partial [Rhodobacteraceae bacterium]|nr:GFA family protein [Paracoccaceae bacterium]